MEGVTPRDEGLYLLLLKDTADAVARSGTLEAALNATVEMVAKRLSIDVCSIYLVDDANGDLVLRATHGLRPESIGQVRMKTSEGLTGLVAETETSFFTSRADEHPRFRYFPETGEERFRSFGGVPLMQRAKCIGVLTVQTVRAYPFHANEVVVLETLAKQVVSLIDVTRRLAPAATKTQQAPGKKAPDRAKGLLVGLGTSPGSGLGTVVTLGVSATKAPPPARAFLGVAEEIARFERARAQAKQDLEAFASQVERGSGDAAGKIFRAHVELVLDPGLDARVREKISNDREPVERAVHSTIEEYVALLRSRANVMMRERAHDFLDVRDQLLHALDASNEPSVRSKSSERLLRDPAKGGVVVLAEFLTPAETAHLDPQHVVAIVTEHGSETSHASILARSLGIPAVVAIPELTRTVGPGDRLLVDGDNGFVFHDPDAATVGEYAKRTEAARAAERTIESELAARRSVGPLIAKVELLANVGLPNELNAAKERGANGIGLLRTEFFFLQQKNWPTVTDQVAFYRRAFKAAPAGPIIVRLLDAGGDKELPYVEHRHEPNPILGLRSVRFLLAHPDVLRTQIRALLESAQVENADVRLLLPLVTTAWELSAAREMIEEASASFGFPTRPLGMMVEAPSVLYQLDDLVPLSDFVSIGTNDLTQYLLAVDRDNELVRHYYSPYHPAVVRALHSLGEGLAKRNVEASICGEMAGDPLGALALFALGYRRVSVRPRAITALRCLVHCFPEQQLPPLKDQLLRAETAEEVERVLRHALRAQAPFLLEG